MPINNLELKHFSALAINATCCSCWKETFRTLCDSLCICYSCPPSSFLVRGILHCCQVGCVQQAEDWLDVWDTNIPPLIEHSLNQAVVLVPSSTSRSWYPRIGYRCFCPWEDFLRVLLLHYPVHNEQPRPPHLVWHSVISPGLEGWGLSELAHVPLSFPAVWGVADQLWHSWSDCHLSLHFPDKTMAS